MQALSNYGLNIGIAFQLTDDALDYSSTEEEFGKQVGQDLIEGKMTLPLFYSIQDASSNEKKKAKEILNKDEFGDDELSFILEIVKKYKGVDKTTQSAKSFIVKAKDSISVIPPSKYNKSLNSLADFIVNRRN